MAATSAAQEGLSVALVEPGQHVGGIVSGGLSYTDASHSECDRQERDLPQEDPGEVGIARHSRLHEGNISQLEQKDAGQYPT